MSKAEKKLDKARRRQAEFIAKTRQAAAEVAELQAIEQSLPHYARPPQVAPATQPQIAAQPPPVATHDVSAAEYNEFLAWRASRQSTPQPQQAHPMFGPPPSAFAPQMPTPAQLPQPAPMQLQTRGASAPAGNYGTQSSPVGLLSNGMRSIFTLQPHELATLRPGEAKAMFQAELADIGRNMGAPVRPQPLALQQTANPAYQFGNATLALPVTTGR